MTLIEFSQSRKRSENLENDCGGHFEISGISNSHTLAYLLLCKIDVFH
jgi:hypothetical protein